MDSEIKKFLTDLLNFDVKTTFHFRKICGLTFVFKEEITIINDNIGNGEISPIGIIYTENDEYYLAPLDKAIQVDAIIEEYVKKILK